MNKVEKYQLLQQQIKALSAGETDQVAVMANVAAATQSPIPNIKINSNYIFNKIK